MVSHGVVGLVGSLLVLALLYNSVEGVDDCGGRNVCGSLFSQMACKGRCCHDAFNAWCCPGDAASMDQWQCFKRFNHDANHCYAPNSCSCLDPNFQIVAARAAGNPQPVAAADLALTQCCAPKASGCGFGTQVRYRQYQKLYWENTFTSELSVGATIDVANLNVKLSNVYRNGAETERELEITVSTACRSGAGGFPSQTFVNFTSQGTLLKLPIILTVRNCGETQDIKGTVEATVLKGSWDCQLHPCKQGCDPKRGCKNQLLDSDPLHHLELDQLPEIETPIKTLSIDTVEE
jgi:hypothetical protein